MVASTSLISVWAAQLTLAREQLRWSQRELAKRIGVSPARLCSWENGAIPSLPHLIAWAAALGFEVDLFPSGGDLNA